MQEPRHGTVGRWLRLGQAAPLLQVSHDTLCRRIKRGQVEARIVRTGHGPAWEVWVVAVDLAATSSHEPLLELVTALQTAMLALAERCGRLEAELDLARACIRDLERCARGSPGRNDVYPPLSSPVSSVLVPLTLHQRAQEGQQRADGFEVAVDWAHSGHLRRSGCTAPLRACRSSPAWKSR
jgi:hypothetical protein